jgi:hypothetical protein
MPDQPEPCRCHACVIANVPGPSVTVPGFKNRPARDLHGVELREHYEMLAKFRELRQRISEAAAAKRMR